MVGGYWGIQGRVISRGVGGKGGYGVMLGWVQYRGSKGTSLGCCMGGEGIKGVR